MRKVTFVLGGVVPISDTEEESERFEAYLEKMGEKERREFLEKNWERIFDTETFENEWTHRGHDVQATFWELKREHVRGVKFFVAGTRKVNIMKTGD